MQAIRLDTSQERFIISIDKNILKKEDLIRIVENIRLEFLAKRVNFDEEIEIIGEDIKRSWWQQNKNRFIPNEAL